MVKRNILKNRTEISNIFNNEFDLDLKVSDTNPTMWCDPVRSSSCSHRCTRKCSNSCSCDCKPNS